VTLRNKVFLIFRVWILISRNLTDQSLSLTTSNSFLVPTLYAVASNAMIVLTKTIVKMTLMSFAYLLLMGQVNSFMSHRIQYSGRLHRSTAYLPLSATLVCVPKSDPTSEMAGFEMREACNYDRNLVVDFLEQLRAFHVGLLGESGHPPHSPPLIKEGDTIQSLMPQIRNCHVILAQPTSLKGGVDEAIGFASYHLKYSGFGAPLMHMEHLFVNPKCRSKGAGLALMNELATIGKHHKCSHVEWSVSSHNVRGVEFYIRLGALGTGKDPTLVDCAGSSIDASNTMKWIPSAWEE
jgi:ribosomal protein S18 acetylase RimI-like enzyme